jgi:YD repeat-containing protein
MGRTLGSLESDALAGVGDAAFVRDGGAQFTVDHAHGIMDLAFTNGRLTALGIRENWQDFSIPAITDPWGIALGAKQADIIARRGVNVATSDANGRHYLTYTDPSGTTWEYTFNANDDKLRGIYAKLSADQVKALSAAQPPAAHGGTSFDDAIMNLASDEPSGAQNIGDFLLHFSCPGDDGKPYGRWREDSHRVVDHNGKKYDVLRLHCNLNGKTRELYFDITSFFGKT